MANQKDFKQDQIKKIRTLIRSLIKNWDKVEDKFKIDIRGDVIMSHKQDLSGLTDQEHNVIVLLDRQKPSVERSYDFDEERITLTRTGKVVWGFDSGCSCPSPWHDNYPECYSCSETWSEFEVNLESFDVDVLDDILSKCIRTLSSILEPAEKTDEMEKISEEYNDKIERQYD